MSVEKEARKALRWMIFWRLVGELWTLPQYLIRGIITILSGLGQWCKNIEMAVFTLELSAARRYKLLTGLDLPTAAGDPSRYLILDPQRADDVQAAYMAREMRNLGGGEEE